MFALCSHLENIPSAMHQAFERNFPSENFIFKFINRLRASLYVELETTA